MQTNFPLVSFRKLAMEEHIREFNQLRNQLTDEMFRLVKALEKATEEEYDGPIRNMLNDAHETGRKFTAQIQLYTAIVQLKNNIKQMSESIPLLYE